MARKRDADVKTAMEGWLTGDGPDTADAPELDALALYRRAGVDGELVAMAQNGRAWRVPDRAGGWAARAELRDVSAHGLTRLGAQAETRARARVGAGPADLDRAELVRRAAETARVAYGADATTPPPTPDPGAPTPAAPARENIAGPLIRSTATTRTSSGRLLRRTIYTTPEEWAAVLAAAEAESRATGSYVSASDLARRALRQALGLPDDGVTS